MMQKHLVIMIWDLDFGGIQTRIETILSKLAEESFQELIITILLKRSSPIRVMLPNKKNLEVRAYSNDYYKGKQLQFDVWLLQQLWELNPSHILTFSNRFSAMAIAYKLVVRTIGKRVKVVVSEEIFLSKYISQYESKYWFYIVSLTYRFADQIIVLTQAMMKDLTDSFKIPNSKIAIIPTWIKRNLKTQKRQLSRKKYDLIFVGRLAPEKRVIWIIALAKYSFRTHRKIKIAIVGTGPEENFLKTLVKRNRLSGIICFEGYKSHREITKFLIQSKILVLPSQNEGLPMVILEAANLGVSTIATNFHGAEEVIENHQTGLIIASLADFCEKTLQLLEKPDLVFALGQNAAHKVQAEFSFTNLDRFLSLVLQ